MKYLRKGPIMLAILLAFVSCGKKHQQSTQTLTDEQKAVCEFIAQVFGNPNEEFYSINGGDARWEEYLANNDHIWGKNGLLASHCAAPLVQIIESKQGRDIWEQSLGGEDVYGEPRYFNAFRYVFLIVVDEDWYTYYAFDKGNFCSHKVHATVPNGEVIIDDIDISADYNMTLDHGYGANRPKWLMGAWVSQAKDKYYLFENYTRCNLLELQAGLDPIISTYDYVSKRNKQVNLLDGEIMAKEFERQQDSLLVSDSEVFRKVLTTPIILIKNQQ